MGKNLVERCFLTSRTKLIHHLSGTGIIYYIVWMIGLSLLFYKHLESPLLVIAGSVVWAFAMIGFAVLLSKIGIRLKL